MATPRERVAKHLSKALNIDVPPEDIRCVQGGTYKVLHDILECWSVIVQQPSGNRIEIQGGSTLTRCARGIRLEPNSPNTSLYGDFIAYPIDPS